MKPPFELNVVLDWLLNYSLQVSALVLLVLLVQWVFRRQLTNRWRFALWWIVLIRLLVPIGPESTMSLFNYWRPVKLAKSASAVVLERDTSDGLEGARGMLADRYRSEHVYDRVNHVPADAVQFPSLEPASKNVQPSASSPVPAAPASVQRPTTQKSFLVTGVWSFWAGGAVVLAGCVAVQLIRFRRQLANASSTSNPALQELLENCRREFGVRRRIELLETEAVKSPSLFGLFRLRLLMPKELSSRFSERELRYIFLHELAHVKRGDLWLNWLVTALQIVHWFNPIIWLGFARLRADRELACDEMVLVHAGERTGESYGGTIIKLLEGLSRPAAIPGLVGILEDKKQMRRRIAMIASFRKPGRWSMLAALLLGVVAATTLTDAQSQRTATTRNAAPTTSAPNAGTNTTTRRLLSPVTVSAGTNLMFDLPAEDDSVPRPDLTGTVRAKWGGPLSATVFIATAGPKVGTSVFCPSCYADCSKKAASDESGAFKIESLNPQLRFEVLAVAKGYKPKSISKVDPVKGPIAFELEPAELADAAPDRSLRGRIVNAARKGEPVEGAVVEMVGTRTREGGGSWGALKGIDPLAVTDKNGEFLITSKEPFEMMDIKVTARGLAPKNFNSLPSGTPHELAMTSGGALSGRVLFEGEPLAGVSVGISGTERQAGEYLGHFEVATGSNGVFAFVNLPPNADFYIYGLMDSLKRFGAIPMRTIRTPGDGSATDLGDLEVKPAHRLAGRIVLSDGAPIPEKTRLVLGREEPWDVLQLTLDKDGNFDTAGIPSEPISVSVRVKGYYVSPQNRSMDPLNSRILGRVDRDTTNLVFLLEKGAPIQRPFPSSGIVYERLEELPLHGTEGVVSHSQEWKISGRVVDQETQRPIASFRVSPAQNSPYDRGIDMDWMRSVAGTNGSYEVYVSKRFSQPVLKVEAEGYLPNAITVLPRDAADVDVALKKGSGPRGRVLSSDGAPVSGVTVLLLCDGSNQGGLDTKGELQAYGNTGRLRVTDVDGQFDFKPEWGMNAVVASSSNGFALVSLDSLASNSAVVLQPYGIIRGTLNRPKGLGTNEDLVISFANGPRGRIANLNYWNFAASDSDGKFEFRCVPAGRVQISSRIVHPDSHGSWETQPLQEVELRAGETVDVKIDATSNRGKRADFDSFERPPEPQPIPGAEISGVVLLPDGKPASDAEVAIEVEGKYLALGRGKLSANYGEANPARVKTAPNGTFRLPLYEKAVGVIAVSEEGVARKLIGEFKASPKLEMRKWGRIEGSLSVNGRPGANEVLNVGPSMLTGPNMFYDMQAFQMRTDAQGRFAMDSVPPGLHNISRQVSIGSGSWTYRQVAAVNIKPGETVSANIASAGRPVTGHFRMAETNISFAIEGFHGALLDPKVSELERQIRKVSDAEERKRLTQSDEYRRAIGSPRYNVYLSEEGVFRAEDVPPGEYRLSAQYFDPKTVQPKLGYTQMTVYSSTQTITIPPSTDATKPEPYDCGTIDFKSEVVEFPSDLSQHAGK